MALVWTLIIAVLVLGTPFTLWWWKQADKWYDAEHKRFKEKPDDRERVVVKQDERGRSEEITHDKR
jgi:hypothetical protein